MRTHKWGVVFLWVKIQEVGGINHIFWKASTNHTLLVRGMRDAWRFLGNL